MFSIDFDVGEGKKDLELSVVMLVAESGSSYTLDAGRIGFEIYSVEGGDLYCVDADTSVVGACSEGCDDATGLCVEDIAGACEVDSDCGNVIEIKSCEGDKLVTETRTPTCTVNECSVDVDMSEVTCSNGCDSEANECSGADEDDGGSRSSGNSRDRDADTNVQNEDSNLEGSQEGSSLGEEDSTLILGEESEKTGKTIWVVVLVVMISLMVILLGVAYWIYRKNNSGEKVVQDKNV